MKPCPATNIARTGLQVAGRSECMMLLDICSHKINMRPPPPPFPAADISAETRAEHFQVSQEMHQVFSLESKQFSIQKSHLSWDV